MAGGNSNATADNQLNLPYGIYVDLNGILYIAEYGNHRISKWLPSRTIPFLIDYFESSLDATSGIVIAGESGVSGSWSYQFSNPTAITFDQHKNMFVMDSSNKRIQKWVPAATYGITVVHSMNLNDPIGMNFDTNGNLVVADHSNRQVLQHVESTNKTMMYPSNHQVVLFSVDCCTYLSVLFLMDTT